MTSSQRSIADSNFISNLSIQTLRIRMFVFEGVAALTSASVAALYFCQNKLLYPSWAQGARNHIETPASRDLPYSHVLLTSEEGIEIEGYDIRNTDEDSTSTCLILCPNAGNIGYFIPIMETFYKEMGMSVFIFSYRGYGKSSGSPTEEGIKRDSDCVIDYITKDPFHSKKNLVLYGRSLGGAVAIYIAAKYPELVSAVILENTFLNVRKVIPYFLPYLKYVANFCRDMWDSETEIEHTSHTTPFLFLSGSRDQIVDPAHMKKLRDLCPSRDKEFHEFPNGFHNDTISEEGYWDTVKRFLYERDLISKS
ncbi:alpha/beta hydrolase KNAG_0A01220 [Huiozyma naganishii CBS 8797]|uniref:Serine aminopeptidase S33 domain-containing protein n=1 Tax=Huiozyma naganishii (strain ATCC MYA-139 / BCRC 22969 / CBS 8797 / KCTC 17520 / NBRC 10181 / NCYC 3082 / Yp74L-3) TaxID=1071383 RepID=J7S359_HUIN7|nr:hypothetical protein KNAG_0A01220 [Kazachstania naganishii CBS 8797]CCK67811.1 hypothetical protein KNAG_0A01220 [Kazachstania naganishii CBS 8797]